MARNPIAQRHRHKRPSVRSGRPPFKLAGEVDERILDAALVVFLERGFAGASIDEIAARARAGKPTIYARFPDKEALFAAVVLRNVAVAIERFGSDVPSGATIDERLINLGKTILDWVLTGNTVDLMRVTISEASRLPDLASSVHRMARQRGEEAVGLILSETVQSDALAPLPAFAPDQLPTTAQIFVDLVVFPLVIRALFGENIESLQAELGPHLSGRVAFFLAACRQR